MGYMRSVLKKCYLYTENLTIKKTKTWSLIIHFVKNKFSFFIYFLSWYSKDCILGSVLLFCVFVIELAIYIHGRKISV